MDSTLAAEQRYRARGVTEPCRTDAIIDVPLSVISANVRLALRWRSMFSEKTKVLSARRGSPEKKSFSPRCGGLAGGAAYEVQLLTFSRYCKRSATASRSLSARTGS